LALSSKHKVLGIIGFAAFVIGIIIAIICGVIAPNNTAIIVVLLVLGIIIGALNVTSKEISLLLLAVVALIVVGGVFEPLKLLGIGAILDQILRLFAILMAPAAVIAAVRALWSVGFPTEKVV
jgi:hypothetical protein